ncbi:MAG TPA: nucleoside-diphosphate sugar epimerase/dehydratase [Vicinamibacterales bacterium]|nr:nucleoside-diphosphate sugar epimerase/dehydratase [Vicinamibacterales bacterium]
MSFGRNRYVLLADLVGFACAAAGAFALRFDWLFLAYRAEFLPFLAAVLLIKPAVFLMFGMYRRVWRYTSVQDLLGIVLATSAASIALAIAAASLVVGHYVGGISRSVLFIDWVLTLLVASGVRLTIRLVYEAQLRTRVLERAADGGVKKILVAGAGSAGTLVVRELQRNPQLRMLPVGFVDDEVTKLGRRVQGLRVLGPTHDIESVVRRHGIDEVIIAMPTATGQIVRAIVDGCRAAGIPSRTIPGVYELLGGTVTVNRIRDIEITDLLRRAPTPSHPDPLPYLTGATVLVTGAGGSIGSELSRQVARAGPSTLVLLGHGENSIFEAREELAHAFPQVPIATVIADVRDRGRIERVFMRWRPSVVLHAAAHKHVPLMEENPEEALSNNVLGTYHVVEAALACAVERFVMISTDKAVSPVNLMGASKRLAEFIVRDASRRTGRAFMVVRFGNVLGSRGSVVPAFKRQIAQGGPITITHPDMSRFFMTIPEAVHLVLQAGGMGRGGEVFALNMGEPVRIVDLATDLIRLSGFRPEDIPIVFTGLRPGEKLDEHLWEPGAEVELTPNPEILRIKERSDTGVSLPETIDLVTAAVARGDRLDLEAILATVIPSFVPGSSTGTSRPSGPRR